jgi:hypothetical protein
MRAERAFHNHCEFDWEMREIHEPRPPREALAPGEGQLRWPWAR